MRKVDTSFAACCHPCMLTYTKRLFARILVCLSLATLSMGYAPLVCLPVAALSVGCALTSPHAVLEARFPHARIHPVCVKPKLVGWDANEWVYTPGGTPVSSADEIFPMVAARADVVFTFDATAPEGSTRLLTIPDNEINCGAWLHAQIEQWCPLKTASFEKRADPRWLAEPEPAVRSPYLQGVPTAAFAPNCETLVREGQKRQVAAVALEIGRQYGDALGDLEGRLKLIPRHGGKEGNATLFEKDPKFLVEIQTAFAQRLNSIPALPTYYDVEFANVAQLAFEQGFGAGMAEANRKSVAILVGFEVLHALSGNVAAVAETAGAKAFNVAMNRLRAMPIFIPGAANGAGFFLRLPNAPPTTSTAPTFIEPRMPAPASIARAPSGPPPAANAATNSAVTVTTTITRTRPSGQLHHGISDKVFKALEEHRNLKGVFKLRDPQFTARAATPEAHNGYQQWHVKLDDEIVKFINETDSLTPKDFAAWLYKRYRKPDLAERFPGGLGTNK